jgi:hypothetical protein
MISRKNDSKLFRISGKSGSDELEIISFIMKSEEMLRVKLKIFKFLESNEIKYISKDSLDENTIYILVNTGENYFFSYQFIHKKVTELVLPKDVGLSPTFQKLSNNLFISIGGSTSRRVHIYDMNLDKWYYIGQLNSIRIGAYAIWVKEYKVVYICGGKNEDGDDSLEIEYFKLVCEEDSGAALSNSIILPTSDGDGGTVKTSIVNNPLHFNNDNNISLSESFYPTELKRKNSFKNDFLLRKSNSVVIPLIESDTYFICGGENLFGPTKTCVLYDAAKDIICLTNSELPKFVNSSNPNAIPYKSSNFYFYSLENAVISYSYLDRKFEVIEKELVDL